jgi:hypothetical protein
MGSEFDHGAEQQVPLGVRVTRRCRGFTDLLGQLGYQPTQLAAVSCQVLGQELGRFV